MALRASLIFTVQIIALIDLRELRTVFVPVGSIDYGNVPVPGHQSLRRIKAVEAKFRPAHELEVVDIGVIESLVSPLPIRLHS